MKILFTCSSMCAGGAERVISSLSSEFSKYNHEISILMISYNKLESFYKLDKKVQLFSLTQGYSKRVNTFKRLKLLRKKIKEINPDVIISFCPHNIFYTYFSSRKLNIKFIVSERNDPNSYSLLYKILNKYCFKRADACVFQTHDALDYYKKTKHSVVIYNPVNLSFVPKQPCNYRKNIIVSVGRLTEQKNFKLLIDSFNLFHKLNNNFILNIFGDGIFKENLINYIKFLKLDQSVFLLGNDPDWQKKSFDAKMFIMTSNYEGMPNALVEALCLGIPSISTDCPIGGPRELSKKFSNLRLVEMNNINALVKEMNLLSKETIIFKNKDTEEFSLNNISKEWLNLIERTMN